MIDEKQVQEADAAITEAVSAFVSEFESLWGRWENVAPRVRHREHAAGAVHGIVRSIRRHQDRRWTGDGEVARCPGRLPGL